jgi:hypothetical protein
MSVTAVIYARDYTRRGGKDRWRASWREDHLAWLDPYFLPEIPSIEKCAHGNGRGLDCTACRPYLVPWDGGKLVPNGQVRIDLRGRPLYFLRLFHRTYDYRIEEHYVSPYDSHFRRSGVVEYEGGYITAGWSDDGVAIRARKRHGSDEDEFEFYPSGNPDPTGKHNGVFATFPRPDTECEFRFSTPTSEEHERIESFRFSTNRATRLISRMACSPTAVFSGTPDRVKPWIPDRRPPETFSRPPAPSQLIPRRTWSVKTWLRSIGVEINPAIPERPSNKELVRRNYGPSAGMKVRTCRGWLTIVRPSPGNRLVRKPWPQGWRTERKMRDTAASLKMYDYGSDGLINVQRMQDTARENYAARVRARSKACGVEAKQTFWPGSDNTPRGSTDARPCGPVGKEAQVLQKAASGAYCMGTNTDHRFANKLNLAAIL